MYSAPYGFANAAPGPGFNGAGAPPPQNPHMQPGPMPNQPQPMMYNPQQFPMGAQGPFPGGPNMMPGAGPGGMPQNAMPHMGANGQSKCLSRFHLLSPSLSLSFPGLLSRGTSQNASYVFQRANGRRSWLINTLLSSLLPPFHPKCSRREALCWDRQTPKMASCVVG